ncbi:MAG: hypothetical protein OXE94_10305 [Aestuariivita sp.]|nr:hypothetical protein [Aestuariivita sp.]MCY4201330.1 hypothetical protein [Aestuariivita sp.]MCY4287985.1 hypothetical protein [Aestuariivita sp.]MCY4347928.1 hypothetical protein [Aestuariivita sp.]
MAPAATKDRIASPLRALIQSNPAGANAGLGQHPAVTDENDLRQTETLLEDVDLVAHGRRVCGVAIKHLRCDRTPIAVTQ